MKAARRIGMAALGGAALLLVAGCGETGNFRPACPNVGIVRDAATLRVDAEGGQAVALLASIPAICAYDDAGVSVSAVLTIQAEPVAGSSATRVPVEYFVAVTDPDRKVLTRRTFTTTIDVSGGAGSVEESLEQFIAVPVTQDARWYEVLVGFQLPADQVDENRRLNESRR